MERIKRGLIYAAIATVLGLATSTTDRPYTSRQSEKPPFVTQTVGVNEGQFTESPAQVIGIDGIRKGQPRYLQYLIDDRTYHIFGSEHNNQDLVDRLEEFTSKNIDPNNYDDWLFIVEGIEDKGKESNVEIRYIKEHFKSKIQMIDYLPTDEENRRISQEIFKEFQETYILTFFAGELERVYDNLPEIKKNYSFKEFRDTLISSYLTNDWDYINPRLKEALNTMIIDKFVLELGIKRDYIKAAMNQALHKSYIDPKGFNNRVGELIAKWKEKRRDLSFSKLRIILQGYQQRNFLYVVGGGHFDELQTFFKTSEVPN